MAQDAILSQVPDNKIIACPIYLSQSNLMFELLTRVRVFLDIIVDHFDLDLPSYNEESVT